MDWLGWTMEYVSYMVGVASRIKPFHADDDTLALRALIFFWTLLLSILRTRHYFCFAFWPLAFPPLSSGIILFFPPTYLEGMWEALGRLAYLNATLAYVGLWMKFSKEERKRTG